MTLQIPIGSVLTWDDDHCEVRTISAGRRPSGEQDTRRDAEAQENTSQRGGSGADANAGMAAASERCDRLDVIGGASALAIYVDRLADRSR